MGWGADEPGSLPADPVLAEVATAMEETGRAAWMFDDQWRFVHVSRDARSLWVDAAGGRLGSVAVGHHIFSTEALRIGAGWRFGLNTTELWRGAMQSLGGLVLADTEGGPAALRALVDPALVGLVDELVPYESAARGFRLEFAGLRGPVVAAMLVMRIRDDDGRLRGTVLVGSPEVPMSVLGGLAWERDLAHLVRMERFTRAGRHPIAILFADLEGSSALMRSLSTAAYFTLGRRLVRTADQCVVDAGGVVGRHVGDGVVAFFPAETSGGESGAARACIASAKALQESIPELAVRAGLEPDALRMRFGLHWGATVYMGKISTLARTEVTALGDPVNEASRIEQSASGGRVLASKELIERLDQGDAAAMGIDLDRIAYTRLGDLDTATAKARRDAPWIAVCEL
jgi:class 3 adenylate cyclase